MSSLEPRKSKRLGLIVGAVFFLGGVYGVFFVDWKKEEIPEPQPIRPLKMFQVGETSLPPVREYPGKVTARDTVVLAFQVEGQIVEFPILKGQGVNKGDLLAKLDDRDYRNRYNAAKAEYDQAKVQLERIRKAVTSGAVSRTDLTNAETAFERARASLEIAQKALDDTVLEAPYDAVISNTFVENFQNVQAKQAVVGVQDIHSIEVEVSVPQERILKMEEQRGKFRFTAAFDPLPDANEFDVKFKELTTEADPLTQTYAVTFTMPVQDQYNIFPYNIFPGMTATLREYPIEGAFPESARLLVPFDAVPVDGQGQYYVWKVQEQNGTLKVHRKNVTVRDVMEDRTGDRTDMIEILDGLTKGDRIAAQGVHLLQEGQQVREYVLKEQEGGK